LIDYVKILLLSIDIERLLKLSYLDFKFEVSEKTGELSAKRIAEYHYCKITIYDTGVVLFTGSIHKLYNSLNDVKAPNYKNQKVYKGFNGNQFTLENTDEVRNHLAYLFDCEPEQMLFQNIELGVNTTPNFNPNLYIKGLLYHKNILFEYRYNNNLAQAEHQRFIFKIYNKSNQYGMSENVLRIELKITKTEELKTIDIRTFSDVNTITLNKAKQMLLRRFEEVVHYDYTINKKALTKREKQLIKSYSNPRYWIVDLKSNYRFRHKKKLLQITCKYSDDLHQHLRQNLIQKCSIINRLSESAKCSIINSSSIGLNMLQTTSEKTHKKCPITGIDLKHEKEGAKYIRTTTLNHLFQNDKNTFEDIVYLLLNNTKGNHPKYEKDIVSHLAKQVRNRYYNQLTIKQTGYRQKKYSNQYSLNIN
jgi:hypothetical protein